MSKAFLFRRQVKCGGSETMVQRIRGIVVVSLK